MLVVFYHVLVCVLVGEKNYLSAKVIQRLTRGITRGVVLVGAQVFVQAGSFVSLPNVVFSFQKMGTVCTSGGRGRGRRGLMNGLVLDM